MRNFIQIAFDGTAFHGWQIQDNAHTVQAELNKALSTILRKEIFTTGCGRTDTGVHATKFYAHFDADLKADEISDLMHQLNCILPFDIAVKNIIKVNETCHARFDAVSRTYEYKLHQHKDPFLRYTAWYYPHILDLRLMNSVSKLLLQHTDFSSFSKSRTQTATNNCIISEALWTQTDQIIVFKISANRFLRNMVRAIVGTLLEVGRGKLDSNQFLEILESKNRSEAGPSVPAHGLSLVDISYPYIK